MEELKKENLELKRKFRIKERLNNYTNRIELKKYYENNKRKEITRKKSVKISKEKIKKRN
jgi:hypothetical protein